MRLLSPPLTNALRNPFTAALKTTTAATTRYTPSSRPRFPKPHVRTSRMASMVTSTSTSTSTTSTTARADTTGTEPTFSSNYDPEQGRRDLRPLLRANGGKWTLIGSGKGVERAFKFKTFKKTWEFMNIVAAECAVKKHHPEWSNVYNTTFIRWTTHSPAGLSEKDILMARFCDDKAGECGEVEVVAESCTVGDGAGDVAAAAAAGQDVGQGGGGGGVGRELVDRVAAEGGDCCVPKGKGRGMSS